MSANEKSRRLSPMLSDALSAAEPSIPMWPSSTLPFSSGRRLQGLRTTASSDFRDGVANVVCSLLPVIDQLDFELACRLCSSGRSPRMDSSMTYRKYDRLAAPRWQRCRRYRMQELHCCTPTYASASSVHDALHRSLLLISVRFSCGFCVWHQGHSTEGKSAANRLHLVPKHTLAPPRRPMCRMFIFGFPCDVHLVVALFAL